MFSFFSELMKKFKLEYEGIMWEINLEESDSIIKTHNQKLETILRNLVDNAVKYGNGEVGIFSQSTKRNFEITISDNGSGIPEKYREKIFDKFFRIPTDNRHDVKGYGLGMYLVKQYLKGIRGSIHFESGPNGSSFIIRLPR